MSENRKNIVMKFGGTSVKDSESIRNVIRIVSSCTTNPVVVVSAIAQATNTLEKIAKLSSENKTKEAKELLKSLIKRHIGIADELVKDKKLHSRCVKLLDSYTNHLLKLIAGVSIINELSLRTLDAFRVFGEVLSSIVIYYAMKSHGLNAELIDSRKIIITDNEFSRAYPNFHLTRKNIQKCLMPLLKKNKIVLAQGFIGSTTDGISTTMGRESSDFSAVIYGALIDAKEIQIWTDVDGVLSADPKMIKSPLKLSEISFQEMEELSNFGAKVLHKNSVKPAREKKIPIRILNSKNIKSNGTLINSKLSYHKLIKSITYKPNIIALRLTPKENINQYIFWEMMLNILSKHKPQIDILVSSNNAIIIIIAENSYTKIHYEELKGEFQEISDFQLLKGKALITLVGSNLNLIPELEKRIFYSLPELKAECLVFGFNQYSFSLLVDKSKCGKMLTNLHNEFFLKGKINKKLFSEIK